MSHIIVTGGAGGIGGAVHEKLVSEVDSVSLFDNAFPERPLNWACENSGGTRIKCDVTSMSEVVGAVRLAEAEHGAVSGLVIAAGILRPGHAESTEPQDLKDMLSVNILGASNVIQAAVPSMIRNGGGQVVVISSNSARIARADLAGYSASKAGLSMLARSYALHLAEYGIGVNIVSPGSTRTDRRGVAVADAERGGATRGTPSRFRVGIPTGRICEPEEIAEIVAFIVLGKAPQLVAADIVLDGGASLGA